MLIYQRSLLTHGTRSFEAVRMNLQGDVTDSRAPCMMLLEMLGTETPAALALSDCGAEFRGRGFTLYRGRPK